MSEVNEMPVANRAADAGNMLKGLRDMPESRLILAILIGSLALAWQSEAFLSAVNIRSVLLGFSFIAIAALGQLVVVITGRIDLSTGSTMALSGMVTALALVAGAPVPLGVCIGIAVGGAVGAVNAFFSVGFGVNAFIVTLGSLQVARGITIGLTEGDTVTGFSDLFLDLGSRTVYGLPIPVWIALALLTVFTVVLRYTGFGRELYAIGGNETAARLAGVNIRRHQSIVFILSGMMAGLAGVLLTARLGAAVSNAAFGYELVVIASVVIGGASLSGGAGTALGVILGALLIGLVNNALVLLVVPTYWQQTFIGAVIVAAALIDRMRRL
ncbi:ABC transporter permease [Oricola sp.]|uniref:ABC transporter permease n=1 Tax=Oricola sp. TaxID=1979950 RepID=UPI003BA9D558